MPKNTLTITQMLTERPARRKLYEAVREVIEKLGPVKVETAKTQISFGAKTKFAWVWLPQMWTKKRPEDSITVSFDLGRQVRNKRIAESLEVRPGRFVHHVVIESAGEIDAQIAKWLAEAYAFGLIDRRKRKKA